MARKRYAVALLIPPPIAVEIDGLRRALGDRQLGRIAPHITLIPPINLHPEQLAAGLSIVREAAAGARPFPVRLGPVTSFDGTSRVRFLAVDPPREAAALHDGLWTGPFDRARRRDFHPHVTIDIDGSCGSTDPAFDLLSSYVVEVELDRLTVLEHVDAGPARHWIDIDGPLLGGRSIVGRGGMEVEVTAGDRVPPDARAVFPAHDELEAPAWQLRSVTARCDGAVAGVASGRVDEPPAISIGDDDRWVDVERHLLAAWTVWEKNPMTGDDLRRWGQARRLSQLACP